MGDLVPLRSPRARRDTTAWLGMIIFLASWAMMFAALFFAYGIVRLRAQVWPPPELPALPLRLPLVNTGLLALSSVALELGLGAVRAARPPRTSGLLVAAAFALGVGFLALQALVWRDLLAAGLRPATGTYASVFYGLTGFHGLHVLVGLVALAWLCARAFAGTYTPARNLTLRLWVMYWHFVGAVWAVVFVTVFLV